MQLTNDGNPQIQGTTKIAPQPMVQHEVGHSRQSSAASTTTHFDQPTSPNIDLAPSRQTNAQ